MRALEPHGEKGIMKNLLLVGALALTTACISEEQASAWINSQFGVGLNWNWASGGNCLGWGLFRDGQPGGPDIYNSFGTTPMYPQQSGCAPTYPTQPQFAPPAPTPAPHHASTGPIPVPAIAPTAPATNASQSLYRPTYNYYQPRR